MSLHDLKILCETPKSERVNKIKQLLTDAGVSFESQEFYRFAQRGENIIVTFHGGNTHACVFVAHHDIDPGTVEGANDNTASVSHLIDLCRRLQKDGGEFPVEVVFVDLEEPGNGGGMAEGSFYYAHRMKPSQLNLVLDVTGRGEVPLVKANSGGMLGTLRHTSRRAMFEMRMPPSDNYGFEKAGKQSVLMTTLPRAEVEGPRPTWAVMHTPDDNLDQIDPENCTWVPDLLERVARGVKPDEVEVKRHNPEFKLD